MAELFMQLSNTDRKEALGVAASASGRPSHLLEKDAWVVWALRTLFAAPLGEHLVFKGGTSLSKVYKAIDRFSEDVDLTYDIRALIPDLVRDAPDALPATKGEERRWTKAVREQLPAWVAEAVSTVIQTQIAAEGLQVELTVEEDKLFISYDPLTTGTGYVRPAVMLDLGARSTGEPSIEADVACDAATLVAGVEFPMAHPRVMRAERTFWEKRQQFMSSVCKGVSVVNALPGIGMIWCVWTPPVTVRQPSKIATLRPRSPTIRPCFFQRKTRTKRS